VLIVLGIAGILGIAVIGMLAAIAIPNFVKARQTAQMNACINHLRIIDGAKQEWALEKVKLGTDTPTQSEVEAYLNGDEFPICPGGGSYTINAVDEAPACSIPNHRLAEPREVLPMSATLEGNTYSNWFFKFQLSVPQGWTIGNKQDFDKAVETRNSGRRPDEKMAKQMESISHLLLMAMETPLGTPAESTLSIILMAVDVRSEPSILTGKDYETLTAQSLKQKGNNREQLNEPYLVKLGSKEFYRVDFKVGVLDRTQHQAYFATIENRHALLITVTADTETEVNQLLTVAGVPQKKND
jgi:hypothetical protein